MIDWPGREPMVEKPLRVEIVAYAPTVFYHCTHCEVVWRETGFSKGVHEEQVASALPPDLKQDYQVVSDWVRRLFRTHCERVVVKVIDILGNYPELDTQVIAASIRHTMHCTYAAMAGADIATVPHGVLMQMIQHPLTDIGIKRFLADWKNIAKK